MYQMDDRPDQDISNEKEKIKEDKEETSEEQPEQPKNEEIIEHPEHRNIFSSCRRAFPKDNRLFSTMANAEPLYLDLLVEFSDRDRIYAIKRSSKKFRKKLTVNY